MLPQLHTLGYSSYTICQKSDQQKAGICTLYKRSELDGTDLGYALLPSFEGKGYAYEAASRIIEAAFLEFNLTKLKAITSENNKASQNLLLRLGFEALGNVLMSEDESLLLIYELKNLK